MSVEIKGYVLVNDSKVKRCYNKGLGAGPLATEDQVLTLYAKFGGLIKKGAEVIKKTGKGQEDQVIGGEIIPNETFWNFNENKAVETEKKEEPKEVKKEEPKEVKKEEPKEVKKEVKKTK